MALLTIQTSASMASAKGSSGYVGTFLAGNTIEAGSPCYVDNSGGITRVFPSVTTSISTARCIGFAAKRTLAGELVSLFDCVTFHYPAGQPIGTRFYLSATANQFENTQTSVYPAIAIVVPDNSITQAGRAVPLIYCKVPAI